MTRYAVRRTLEDIFFWAVAVALCAALLVVGRDDVMWVALAVAVAVVTTVIVVLGPDRAGTTFVVLGTFTAPMSALVVPSATFVTATDLLFAVGFVLLIPTILRRQVSIPTTFALTAFACLLIGLVATLATINVMGSLNFQARFIAGVLIVPLVFLLWRPPLPIVRILAAAYVLGVGVSFLGGIARGDRPGARFIGFTEHPNVLGLTGMFATGLCVFLVTQTRKSLAWIWIAGGAGGLGVVWFSGSRAALVVSVAIAVLFPIVERSARAAGWLLGGGTIGVVALTQIRLGGDSAFDRLTGGGSAAWSDAEREMLFERYWGGFLDRPIIGHGFEESVLGHNVYLQMAYSMGVFGAMAFILLLLVGASQLLLAPKPYNRLAYPILSYALIAPLTSVVWDRYIWVPAALAFVVAADVARVRAGGSGDFVPPPVAEPITPTAPGSTGFIRGRWTGPTRVGALVAPVREQAGHRVVEQAGERAQVAICRQPVGVVSPGSTSDSPSSSTTEPRPDLSAVSPPADPPPEGGGGKRRADVPVDAPPRLDP